MTWSADGFCYGPQINVARKTYGASMDILATPDDQGPRANVCKRFDDKIYLLEKRSTWSQLAITEFGMQTGKSFLDYLKRLDDEIKAHSDAAVADGQPPILRPVVLPSTTTPRGTTRT